MVDQNSSMAEMRTRIEELEVKLGFAEDLLDALNTTAYRQQRQIDFLQQEVGMLRQQMSAQTPTEARALREEIPPHY